MVLDVIALNTDITSGVLSIFHHFFTPDAGLFTLYPVSIGQKGMYQYYNQENQNG